MPEFFSDENAGSLLEWPTLSGVPTFMIPEEIAKLVSSDATALTARASSTRPCILAPPPRPPGDVSRYGGAVLRPAFVSPAHGSGPCRGSPRALLFAGSCGALQRSGSFSTLVQHAHEPSRMG
ncbi:MAG: hypothetical protein NNA30_11225, partial [Nitrospira sp.]|nr:hypothetical protein [Nitrospira sp.]